MEQMKLSFLEMVKWIAVVLAVAFLFSLCTQGKESQTEFSDMSQAILAVAELTDMQQGDNQMIRRLYGLEPEDYEGVLLYYPTSNMGAEEILLIKLSDTTQQETVREAMESRISSQISVFEGYGIEQCAMLEDSVIEISGNYALLVVAVDTTGLRQAFLQAL